MPYIDLFRTMFPEGAGYEHDKMERRTELTEEQRPEEPPNADSHLAIMAGALRTCVSVANRVEEPMCFIDLDGVHAGRPRRRVTSVIGYSHEEAGRAGAVDRSGVPLRGRLGEPQGADARHLRRVCRAGRGARRDEGAHPHHPCARRAACRTDRQRVRNAADAARPVRGPARSAALHGRKGRAHARQPARDPGQDARLRQVRSGPRLQQAGRVARSARFAGRERALARDCDARVALPADEAVGQPAGLRSRRRRHRARSSKAHTRARSWSSGTGRRSRRGCSTSR